MLEFFHQVTAQYSNAVLVAILPLVSDFIKKVELPMPIPIVVEQVGEFRCWSVNDGDVGGALFFTNGLWVEYLQGHVMGFRTPRSYYNLQDPQDISRFYGPLDLNTAGALQLARAIVQRVGYTLEETFTDQEPAVDMPPKIGTNTVPHYRFQWKDPVFGGVALSIEIDAKRKMAQALSLTSPFFRGTPPKIMVDSGLSNRQPAIDVAVSNAFVSASVRKIADFAKRLAISGTFSRKHVQQVEFIGSTSEAWIKLDNACWFVLKHGTVTDFYRMDAVFARPPSAFEAFPRPLETYLGSWKVSRGDAVERVRESIARLGYRLKDLDAEKEPRLIEHEQVGKYVVPRYYVRWLTNDTATGRTIAMAAAEFDADRNRLASLKLVNERLVRSNLLGPTSSQVVPAPRPGATDEEIMNHLEKAMGFIATNTPAPMPPPANPFE